MIKKFEKFIPRTGYDNIYYTLHINGSWDKFLIALDKLEIREEFLTCWDIEGIEELSTQNAEFFTHNTLVLLIADDYYLVRHNIKEFYDEKIISEFEKPINGGDVYVKDYEVSAKKYNL